MQLHKNEESLICTHVKLPPKYTEKFRTVYVCVKQRKTIYMYL